MFLHLFLALPLLLASALSHGTDPTNVSRADRRIYVSFYFAPPPSQVSKAAPVYQGFAISTDRGENWESRGWMTNAVSAIAVDPSNPDAVFLATDYGVLASGDAGLHWKLVTGWEMPAVLDIAIRDDSLWAATARGVFVSGDSGKTWTERSNGLAAPNGTYVCAVLPLPGSVLITTANGVFRFVDGETQWRRSGLEGVELSGISVHPADPSHLAAFSSKGGIWISTDAGRSWLDRSAGLRFPQIKCAAFDPRDRSTILAGTQRVGVVRSTDLGRTWELSSGGMTNFNVTALMFDPDQPDRCYAGAENGSFISDNRGKSWQPFSIRLGYVSDFWIQ